MTDSAYLVQEIPVPDADHDAGVVRRWKVTTARTGTVNVVAQFKSLPNTSAPWRLGCTCAEVICTHRQEIIQILAPRAPLGVA